MRFEDERYIRVYTRDTTTTLMLTWEARAVMWEVFRKVDRAGLLELGEDGLEALAATVRIPIDIVERAMPELLRRKVFELRPDGLLICPRFVEAQEALASDKARARASRERARDMARAKDAGVTDSDGAVTPRDSVVTLRDETVTHGHAASHAVTLNHTKQTNHAEPSPPDVTAPEVTRIEPSFALGSYVEGANAGLREATGNRKARIQEPYGAVSELEAMVAMYCPEGLDEQGRLDWVRETATRYVKATFEDIKFQSGFRPSKCAQWLMANPQAAARKPKKAVPPPPRPDKHEFVPAPEGFLEEMRAAKKAMFGDAPGADVRWTPKPKEAQDGR